MTSAYGFSAMPVRAALAAARIGATSFRTIALSDHRVLHCPRAAQCDASATLAKSWQFVAINSTTPQCSIALHFVGTH
ncbi:MAG: hypothetical protein Q8R82_00830 [Hyphomonadaceae bacterium]|nr:hypothetical protein [Hyphomonadaceae bacterium]